jgi:hypothetical protein
MRGMGALIPSGMTFDRALRAGYVGRIECRPYLDWLKTLPCDTCGAPAPSDPSHLNSYKGMGTKAPDLFSIPQCRGCHEEYERDPGWEWHAGDGPGYFLQRCAIYLLQAFFEGRLKWVG